MGIDYDPEYGIGYEISTPEYDEEEYCSDDEWFDEHLEEETGCKYLKVGDYVSGSNFEYYIVTSKKIDENTNLKEIKEELDSILDKYNIGKVSEFGLVGGLRIW